MNSQRVCILGTAPSWTKAPFADPTLRIVSLNDAYSMGVQRVDEFYELHPFDRMWFRPLEKKVLREDEVPRGAYIRPVGHVDWLKTQAATIPVWLKDDPPEGWPVNAQRFPLEDLEAKYGAYWASGPAYILMHLFDRGARDISIYGIHLSTQQEYIEQRPNWEFLLGRLVGAEAKVLEKDGLRIYEGREVVLRMPVEAPILTHGWKYGYEPRPVPVDQSLQEKRAKAQHAYSTLASKLVKWPRWKSKTKQLDELARLKAVMTDADRHARHVRMHAGVA